MDMFITYAKLIGKNTSQLTFWNVLSMYAWAEKQYKTKFIPKAIKKIPNLMKERR